MTAPSGQTPWGYIRRFGTRLRKRSRIHGSSRDWLPHQFIDFEIVDDKFTELKLGKASH
jgi:hypothetical protein